MDMLFFYCKKCTFSNGFKGINISQNNELFFFFGIKREKGLDVFDFWQK
jgi:hypothetical protein